MGLLTDNLVKFTAVHMKSTNNYFNFWFKMFTINLQSEICTFEELKYYCWKLTESKTPSCAPMNTPVPHRQMVIVLYEEYGKTKAKNGSDLIKAHGTQFVYFACVVRTRDWSACVDVRPQPRSLFEHFWVLLILRMQRERERERAR